MSVYLTPQGVVDAYYESEDLNQSSLKNLKGGLQSFLNSQEKDFGNNPSFIIGSAVDLILTGMQGEFDNQYYVSELETKPSEAECAIIQHVFNLAAETIDCLEDFKSLEFYQTCLQTAIEESGWQVRWKMDTKINKIVELGSDYFNDLIKSYGKTILSTTQNYLIQNIVTSLREDETTKHYFKRDITTKLVEIYNQVPIYFKYENVDCKALLDLVIVELNEEREYVSVTPVDLKTMAGNTLDFIFNVKQYRYDIQAAFYSEAIKHWLLSKGKENVKINNFQFVVESTTNPGTPLVYTCTDELLNIGTFGRQGVKSNLGIVLSRPIKGFKNLLSEYIYYQQTEWKQDKRLMNGTRLNLSWDGIE